MRKVEEFITKTKDMRSKKARALSLARWKSMKFSADGQSILISTDANLVLTLHAFEGDVKQASGKYQLWCLFFLDMLLLCRVTGY